MANVLSTSRYKNVKLDLTTTDATTMYTCPSLMNAVIESVIVAEDSNNNDALTMTLTNGSDVYSLFTSKVISANSSVELFTKDLILVSGDVIKVTANTANRLHVIASIIEIPKATTA